MVTALVVLITLVLFVVCLLQVVGVPANWVVLAILAVYKLLGPAASVAGLSWTFLLVMAGLAALGEILEWGIQLKFGRRYGSTAKGNIGGIIGSIIGAIVLLPLFFGFGAVIGALAGAYIGCFVVEFVSSRGLRAANAAAWGAFVGRFLGMSLKLGIGISIVGMAAFRMFP